MNIYDVSKAAGVSIATVSRVINGNPNVSEKTRQKILSVMDEIGYTPNVFARGLGLNTMQTIGIMCSDSSDIYLANAVYYLERELRSNGYDAFLCCTGYKLENKESYLSLLLSKRVDAIILVGSKFLEPKDNSYIISAAKQVPIMLINGYLENPNIYCTLCDDSSAVCDAVTRLINNGRKDIVYLYTGSSYSEKKKLAGYKDALKKHGIAFRSNYTKCCDKDIESAREYLNKMHKEGNKIDSIVTSEDILAVGGIKFAKENNLSIPDDISIIGYNNSLLAGCTDPELTSIDSKVEALCISAVNTLMRVFDGSNVPSKTTISADLIQRNTTNF